jgi:fatty acid amide hydrolase
VVPVTVVKGNESTYTDDYNDTYSKQVRRSLEGSEGLPIGVQVISKPFNEEKILYLMSEIEKSVNFRTKHKPNC